MIVYRLREEDERKIRYPEDIPIIRDYLTTHGKLDPRVDEYTISDLWDDFSDYHDAGWLNPSNLWLELFSHWLNGKDVRVR